jgi:hypothetical protein
MAETCMPSHVRWVGAQPDRTGANRVSHGVPDLPHRLPFPVCAHDLRPNAMRRPAAPWPDPLTQTHDGTPRALFGPTVTSPGERGHAM